MNEQKNSGVSPIAAGITGIILGIAGTIAIALSDEETRIKVKKKVNSMKDDFGKWSDEQIGEFGTKSYKMRKYLTAIIDPDKNPVDKDKDKAKDKAENVLDEQLAN